MFVYLTKRLNSATKSGSKLRILLVLALCIGFPITAAPKDEFRNLLKSFINATSAPDDQSPLLFKQSLVQHVDGLEVLANDALYREFVKEMDLPQADAFLTNLDTKLADLLESAVKNQFYLLSAEETTKLKQIPVNTRRYGLTIFRLLPKDKQTQLVNQIPDSYILKAKENFNNSVETFDVNALPGLSDIAPKSGEVIEGLTPEQIQEFITLIQKYFNGLPLSQKKKILNGYLDLPPHPEKADKIAVALNGAGPMVQKLFQLVGKKHPNPTVREASKKLLETVEKVPFDDIKLIIEKRYGKPLESVFRTFNPKPIATATIGQVHEAELLNGEKVAVKIRKPGLTERVISELDFLDQIAPPSLKDTIRSMKHAIAEEMDFRIEASNLRKGNLYSNKYLAQLPIHIPSMPEGITAQEDVLVTQFMTGTSLNKLLDDGSPAVKDLNFLCSVGKLFEDFTSVWLWRVFKGDGFSHVDLHGGNVKINEKDGKYHLELLDFGSTTSLSEAEVNIFTLITVSALHNDPILLRYAITALQKYNGRKVPEEIKKELYRIVNDKQSAWDKKAAEMFYLLSQGQSYIPANSAQFFRGLLFLQQHFETLNEKIDRADPWKRYPRYTLEKALLKGVAPYISGRYMLLGLQNKNSFNEIMPYLAASAARTKTNAWKERLVSKCSSFFNRISGKR